MSKRKVLTDLDYDTLNNKIDENKSSTDTRLSEIEASIGDAVEELSKL